MVKASTRDKLQDLSGEILKDGQGKEVTVGAIFTNALLTPQDDDRSVSAEEKLKRFLLAKRIFKEDEVELTSDEVVLLRTLISKCYSALLAGQILEWLK